ncbi:putative membrane protein, partial [Pseudomonas amygdali pv. aesculi]
SGGDIYRVAADAVVAFHLLFIVFVLFGGLLVVSRPWLALLHVPAVAWGAAVEFLHLYCPLTPLENTLRRTAGEQGYDGGFVEHYLIPLIYPVGLTPGIQLWLGGIVLLVNVSVYGLLLMRFVSRVRHS